MLITRKQFSEKLKLGQMRIALVGMSNAGKSTIATLLKNESGFCHFEVDQAINDELNLNSMLAAANWMGYPFETAYAEKKKTYLQLEAKHTRVTVPDKKNFVLDTTGSIIYGTEELHAWIRNNFLVVGLAVSADLIQQLIADYFEHPKTVIWGTEFAPQPDEDGIATLKRCYPYLLSNRAKKYAELADVQISAELARTTDMTAQRLLDVIGDQLPASF